MQRNKKDVLIYIDGACSYNPGPGGYGIVIDKENVIIKKYGYELHTTNNRMELQALIRVLDKLSKKKMIKNRNSKTLYRIFTDSAYVYNSIKQHWISFWQNNNFKNRKGDSILNKDLWLEYLSLVNEINIKKIKWDIFKVKGHSGILLNEIADQQARKGVKKAIGILKNKKGKVKKYANNCRNKNI